MDMFNSNKDQLFYPKMDAETNSVIFVKKKDHPFLKSFKEKYIYIIIASALYSVLFTFCLYRNASGITSSIYPICSVAYIIFCAKKIGVTIKKDTLFPIISVILLGINLCITQDTVVLFLDHIAIFLLTVAMLLHIFYEDSKWGLGKYLGQIFNGLFGSLEYIASTIEDGIAYKKEHSTKRINPVFGYVFVGVVVTIPLLVIVLLLLGSADYFFGNFITDIILKPLSNINFTNIDLLIMLASSFVISYALVRKMCAHNLDEEVTDKSNGPAAIAITIGSILGFVYLVFSGFQIFTLFLGQGKLPENYTYAEYAREGFFQLVVVCIINMILVLISLYYFENIKALKVVLAIISACTYIMIASSTYRMFMYVDIYQLTYTRVFVFWALLVIFMAMNGISIYIFNKKFNLFKYCIVMVTVLYIGFAFIRPEALIAKNNLSEKFYRNTTDCQSIDYEYLNKLSSDATPAIVEAFRRERDRYGIEHVVNRKNAISMATEMSFREFNFSLYFEKEVL